jgi:hypothetical protein
MSDLNTDTGDINNNIEAKDNDILKDVNAEKNLDEITKNNTLNNSGIATEAENDATEAENDATEAENDATEVKNEAAEVKNEDKKESITIEINKPFLSNLTQRLNPALLVSLVTYINILTKMKELEPTNTGLDDDIKEFKSIKDSLSTLLRKVQETLKIDEDKREDPDKIINNMASSETFTNFLLFIQSIFSAAVPLSAAILGGKKKRTRRQKAAKATKKKTKKHN